jgi:hypothetical protein
VKITSQLSHQACLSLGRLALEEWVRFALLLASHTALFLRDKKQPYLDPCLSNVGKKQPALCCEYNGTQTPRVEISFSMLKMPTHFFGSCYSQPQSGLYDWLFIMQQR